MSKKTNQIEEFFGSQALPLLKLLAQGSYLKERMRLIEKNLKQLHENSQTSNRERVQKSYTLKDDLSAKEKEYRRLADELESLKNLDLEIQLRLCSGTQLLNALLFSAFSNNILSVKELREKLKDTREDLVEKEESYKVLKDEISELKVTVHRMEKPQQDIDFAIRTLEDKKSEILKDLSQIDSQINGFLKDFCAKIDLNTMENATSFNPDILQTIWQVADDSRELEIISELISHKKATPPKQTLSKIHQDGTILPKTIIMSHRIQISGLGTHHRKVSRGSGKNRSSYWKVFPVEFQDTLNIKSKIKATQFHKKSLVENLHQAIIYERQNSQNEALLKDQENRTGELQLRLHNNIKKLRENLRIDLKQV